VSTRALRILVLLLVLAVLAGLFEFPLLRMQVARLERQEQREEVVARRELIRPVTEGREAKKEMVPIYWLSEEDSGQLAAVQTSLPLGSDPVERARVALESLITGAPTPEQRPLPLDTTLLAFYLLDDGTAVADFSDALSHHLPSGISTEQLALDAITRTLHAAVPQVRLLRILIDGQEAETLAGHVDLSGAFDLTQMGPATPAPTTLAPAPPQPGKAPIPAEKKTPSTTKPRRGE
jgi:sporulation and spore germination protein